MGRPIGPATLAYSLIYCSHANKKEFQESVNIFISPPEPPLPAIDSIQSRVLLFSPVKSPCLTVVPDRDFKGFVCSKYRLQ